MGDLKLFKTATWEQAQGLGTNLGSQHIAVSPAPSLLFCAPGQ